MEQPITVKNAVFKEEIVKLINESGLPAFVISAILKEIQGALSQLEQQQLEEDMEQWKRYLKSKEPQKAAAEDA